MTTITSQTAEGDRVQDRGSDTVECSISPGAAEGTYNVTMRYSNGREIGDLSMSAVLSEAAGGELDIDLQTSSFTLSSTGGTGQPCTASVRRLNPAGALWIDDLRCPRLADPNSPSIACVASGGLIFENCR